VSGNLSDGSAGRSRPPRLRLVVYGGLGAGKSTVTSVFESLGAVAISADRIGHEILRSGHPVARKVAARWPDIVVAGEIDRSRLAAVVFADPAALAELELYTHPAIAAEVTRRAGLVEDGAVVVEVPLVARWFGPEWWWIAVVADESTRLDRAVHRGSDREDAKRRLSAQPDEATYLASADFVVVNDGTLEQLHENVSRIWAELSAF